MAAALTLGGVSFQQLEIPEQIGPIGGVLLVQANDFPGGIRTIRTFGAFSEPVSWRGIFTGSYAETRMQLLDRMRIAGNLISLQFSETQWLGYLVKFRARPKHQWHIPYELEFMPLTDSQYSPDSIDQDALLAAQLAFHIQVMTDLYIGSGSNLFSLPSVLNLGVGLVLGSVTSALTNSNGSITGIASVDQLAINTAVASLALSAIPLTKSADPTVASPALDALHAAQAVKTITASPMATQVTIQTINPNLFTLAAQYLGSAGNWRAIAALNGLSDPQPIGQFNLLIPAKQ